MLAPEEVIPSFQVVMPSINRIPLTATHISERPDGLIHIAGIRKLDFGEDERGFRKILNFGFVFCRVSPEKRVKDWAKEDIVWLSHSKAEKGTGHFERSEVIGLNSSGDVVFFRQKVDPSKFHKNGFEVEAKRFFLRWGATGREMQFRPSIEPLAIDDQKRILISISTPYQDRNVTAILSGEKCLFLRYTSDDTEVDWENKVPSLSPNGDILLESRGAHGSPVDGNLRVFRLRKGGMFSESITCLYGAGSAVLGGDLIFAFENIVYDQYGTGPRGAIYITDNGEKGGLFAPSNCGDATPRDSVLVQRNRTGLGHYFIGGGCTESSDGQIWILTQEEAEKGESVVGYNLSDFASPDVQVGAIQKITPRGILLTKATTVPNGHDAAILIPSTLQKSGADWGD